MSRDKELLFSLRHGFENLEVFDRVRLNSLQDRARMIIERVFGEESTYYERLSGISFRRAGGVGIVSTFGGSGGETLAERQARERAWRAAHERSISLIDTLLEDIDLREPDEAQGEEESTGPKSNRVLVVHGHDDAMRESVARVLTKIGLGPVILNEQPDQGQTIIEKIERFSDVGFAAVLLSPDDIGFSRSDGSEAAKPRARQNVILELGYFAGKLGQRSVMALHKGDLELPSDYDGAAWVRWDAEGLTRSSSQRARNSPTVAPPASKTTPLAASPRASASFFSTSPHLLP